MKITLSKFRSILDALLCLILSLLSSQHPAKKRRGRRPKDSTSTTTKTSSSTSKLPKIAKNDPRRQYATDFAQNLNTADFDKILEFISSHSTNEAVFIHRWVGKTQYLNFPIFLSISGWDNIAEYLFSRCIFAPDFIFQLKETKLYVRSDGFSTVISSFTIPCTRLYDSTLSHTLIIRDAPSEAPKPVTLPVPPVESTESKSDSVSRVLGKLEHILVNSEPIKGKKRKSPDEPVIEPAPVIEVSGGKKALPCGASIVLIGTLTMQLNKEGKVKHYEMSYTLDE